MRKVETPLIIVNFKAYEEATGKKAVQLAKVCESIHKKYGVTIAVSPQFSDIFPVSQAVEIPTLSQHIDPVEPKAFTGHVSPLAVKEAGAVGTLINHSEKKLVLKEVEKCILFAGKYGLLSVCCSSSIAETKDVINFNPDFIAYEPPELIGTGISVSQTKPEVVADTVKLIKQTNPRVKVLCGAGITNGEDVKKALQLGTMGVLVASGVVKAPSPEKALAEFAETIKKL